MSNQGKFIVFEGVDGSGKSTQSKLVAQALGAEHFEDGKGITVHDRINKLPKELLRMYCQNRSNLAFRVGWCLSDGKSVVCDRWEPSTRVYQQIGGIAEGDIQEAIEKYSAGIVRPDWIVWMVLSTEEAVTRLAQRGGAKDPFEEFRFLQRVNSLYHVHLGDHERVIPVYAGRGVEETTQVILAELRARGIDIKQEPS